MGIGTAILEELADGETRTVAQLADATGHTRNSVGKACVTLADHKLIQRTARGQYRITKDGRRSLQVGGQRPGPKGPHTQAATQRPGSMRQVIWAVLRIKRKATLAELATLAGGDESRDPYGNVKKYLHALARSGYVSKLARRMGGDRNIQPVVLLRDTGPQAPVVQLASGGCYDPNENKAYPFAAGPQASRAALAQGGAQ